MFGGNRNKQRNGKQTGNLSQFGLFDIPNDFDPGVNIDDDADDEDLEAELAALSGGGLSAPARPKRKKQNLIPQADLDALASETLKDEDDDVSVDEDDPQLLSELNDIVGGEEEVEMSEQELDSGPSTVNTSSDIKSLLQKRLEMYEIAEKNAKSIGESSRARRYGRAIKTLKDLIRQATAGKPVDESVIPPEVSITLKKHEDAPPTDSVSSPARPAPAIPSSPPPEESESHMEIQPEPSGPEPQAEADDSFLDEEEKKQKLHKLLILLNERKNQYKIAAVTAKKTGDSHTALKYVKIAKQFELVINAVESGQPIDLSKMPGPPPNLDQPPEPKVEESETQGNPPEIAENEDDAPQEDLITAASVAEALEQRLELYKKQAATAQEQGNASKARRMGRIVKQYEQAIKLHKAGKPIPVDELPTPPGYAPIPVEGGADASDPQPKPQPTSPSSPAASSVPSPSSSGSGKFVVTQADKNVQLLVARQKQFKLAALNAKKKGEMNEAKEYLRQALGFDKLIEAARGGLPIDFSSLPLSPIAKTRLEEGYDVVSAEEIEQNDRDDKDILTRMEAQLNRQLKMCLTTRDHNKAIGDVAGANRFERLALNVTKDLDIVRLAQRTPGSAIPKFHYETKEFSVVKSFTELNDNDLELTIYRGINYNCTNPKDIDTYVRYEFPYPQDAHYVDRTVTVKNTNNPEYNTTVIIPIQRNARTCQRVFKRHSLKCEVYAKGWCASDCCSCFSSWITGLFKGDTLIGTANVKLNPLETQCEIHDSFDLMDGRKRTGGKLEVRIRIRQPIATQQVEQIHEKWLVIDS